VYGLALGVTADPRQAQQATLDAFAEMWRTASRCTLAAGDAVAWAMTIAVRRAEGARWRTDGYSSSVTVPVSSGHGSPSDAVPAAESHRCPPLWQLPVEQRYAILLAAHGHLSRAQIAGILTTSPAEITNSLRDALTYLRSSSPDRVATDA
jgi:RNA polymerase sigma-70 factor (ECF subfamily)